MRRSSGSLPIPDFDADTMPLIARPRQQSTSNRASHSQPKVKAKRVVVATKDSATPTSVNESVLAREFDHVSPLSKRVSTETTSSSHFSINRARTTIVEDFTADNIGVVIQSTVKTEHSRVKTRRSSAIVPVRAVEPPTTDCRRKLVDALDSTTMETSSLDVESKVADQYDIRRNPAHVHQVAANVNARKKSVVIEPRYYSIKRTVHPRKLEPNSDAVKSPGLSDGFATN